MTRKRRSKWLLVILITLIPITLILSVGVGSVHISPSSVLSILFSSLNFMHAPADEPIRFIVEFIRLPRTLTCFMVGAALSISGAALQGLFRNPLADPSIIGISSGAALGAGMAIVIGKILFIGTTSGVTYSANISLCAFISGVATTALIYQMGTTGNSTSVVRMLLAGIAINALAGAGIAILAYIADDISLRNITYWQMGSVNGATWDVVLVCGVVLLPACLLLCRYGQPLNALLLGESEARHLGMNIQHIKTQLIILSATAVGVSVSISGIIGFVGLVTPHLIRFITGPDNKVVLPASAMLGGILLVLADIVSRIIFAPIELPVGIITALIGAPFFILILWQQRQRIL